MTKLKDKPVKIIADNRTHKKYVSLDDLIAHFTVELLNTTPENDIRVSEYLRDLLEDLIRFKEEEQHHVY